MLDGRSGNAVMMGAWSKISTRKHRLRWRRHARINHSDPSQSTQSDIRASIHDNSPSGLFLNLTSQCMRFWSYIFDKTDAFVTFDIFDGVDEAHEIDEYRKPKVPQ